MHNPPRIGFSVSRGLSSCDPSNLSKTCTKTCMKLMRGGQGWVRQTVKVNSL